MKIIGLKISLIEYDPRRFFSFDQQNLVYLEMPKVASSSILFTISQYYGVKLNPLRIRQENLWHIQRGKLKKNQANYYKFTFIRNPFDRLVSSYRDKIINQDKKKIPYHYNAPHFSIPENASFADFVKIIVDIPDSMADRHFKSQYATLYDKNRLLVDWIGRFEHLGSDWAELAEKYNFKPDLFHQNSSHNVENIHQDYRLYYTKELAHMVYKRYQKDVDLLGYSHAYEDLLDFIETQDSQK